MADAKTGRVIKFRAWHSGRMIPEPRLFHQNENGLHHDALPGSVLLQFTGLTDKNGKEVYEGDIVRVYDKERYCICGEWEDCKGEDSADHRDHGEHTHETASECEQYICTQEIKWSKYAGYFSEEDTGEFCPPLGADEIQLEIIGNIYENSELLK